MTATTIPAIPPEIANTIVDPRAFADWDSIHDAFSTLRKEAPLAVAHADGFDPFWVVTRFDDIQHVERHNDLFHNGDTFTTLTDKAGGEMVKSITGGSPHLVRSLVQMDNPDHFKHRVLTQSWFLPQNLRELEGRIREIAREFVDKMLSGGTECDFAKDVAFLYPLRVVMEVIGVPQEDEPRMLALTQQLFGPTDPDMRRADDDLSPEKAIESLQEVVADFFSYFTAMSEDRRSNPRNDLATIIANAKIDDEPIGFFEAMSYYIIAATAGHDTTSASTASSMWAIAERPDQWEKLKADPALINGLVEEAIRWETPVKHFMRSATQDTELAGQAIKKGDWMYLSYVSGNRDESRIDRPFEFDITRAPNKHVALGYGAHICLGQHLARMEMRVLWEELLPHLKSVELNGEPTRVAANFVSGPKFLPIRFQTN